MSLILIADSGSTKTDWIVSDGQNEQRHRTIGYNPFFMDTKAISCSIEETLVPYVDAARIDEIHFYGAGCSDINKNAIVAAALSICFPNSKLYIRHDLLAAARAVLLNKKGFTAILGTGSNSCLYDGQNITANINSLGYLLGDEGSGTYIGRRILRDFIRGNFPKDLRELFKGQYKDSSDELLHRVYSSELPNRFLASFCEFAAMHQAHPYVESLVKSCFRDFFGQLVQPYPDFRTHQFNCVGSVGYLFSDYLKQIAFENGMETGVIIQAPIDSLVYFHTGKFVRAD